MSDTRQTLPARPYRIANGLGILCVDRTARTRSVSRHEETTLADNVRKQVSICNRILAGLPRKEYARIRRDLASVTFEVSVVGDEGVIGIPIVLRTHGLPYKIIVQASGTAWRMKADVLRKEFDQCGPLHKLVLHYLHTLIVVLAQSGACNRFHTIQQRLCRWLLTSQDRARSGEIQSTQELLSQMLGANRGSASQVASALQRAGLISYRRGRIAILDRSRLKAAACECYRVVKGEFDRFFTERHGGERSVGRRGS